jgi:microcystin-dependent protein
MKEAVVGDYKWSACNVNFHGWLKCDGSALSKTTYSSLYNIIGTTYGGNSSNFFLPNCQGRVVAAAGAPYTPNGDGNVLVPGAMYGNTTHTLTVAEMPSHNHSGTTNNSTTGITTNATGPTNFGGSGYGLAYEDGQNTMNASVNPGDEPNLYTRIAALQINDPGHHHTITTNATGGSIAHDIQNPTIVLGNVFIYSGIYEPLVPTVDIIGPDDTQYDA